MKLYHIPCKHELSVYTDRIKVKILEVGVGDDSIKPTLLDLIPARSGKITYSCSHCEDDASSDDVGISCLYCGKPVPIKRVYRINQDYSVLCRDCFDTVSKKLGMSRNSEVDPDAYLVSLKLR